MRYRLMDNEDTRHSAQKGDKTNRRIAYFSIFHDPLLINTEAGVDPIYVCTVETPKSKIIVCIACLACEASERRRICSDIPGLSGGYMLQNVKTSTMVETMGVPKIRRFDLF
jgi:hypothetical protein